MEYAYSINIGKGVYVCGNCGREFKIAPPNHKRIDRDPQWSYYGNGQKYNYRGGKGALCRHLYACHKAAKSLGHLPTPGMGAQ